MLILHDDKTYSHMLILYKHKTYSHMLIVPDDKSYSHMLILHDDRSYRHMLILHRVLGSLHCRLFTLASECGLRILYQAKSQSIFIFPVLFKLHWVPIKLCTDTKVLLMLLKPLNALTLVCLADLLSKVSVLSPFFFLTHTCLTLAIHSFGVILNIVLLNIVFMNCSNHYSEFISDCNFFCCYFDLLIVYFEILCSE